MAIKKILIEGDSPDKPYSWLDENGNIKYDWYWLLNRRKNEVEYYGKPKDYVPKNKADYIAAGGDPALFPDEDDVLPDIVYTEQDILRNMIYYIGVGKHKIEANQRNRSRKWWHFWKPREVGPHRYPFEKEYFEYDELGRKIYTEELLARVKAWDAEIEKKKKRWK